MQNMMNKTEITHRIKTLKVVLTHFIITSLTTVLHYRLK